MPNIDAKFPRIPCLCKEPKKATVFDCLAFSELAANNNGTIELLDRLTLLSAGGEGGSL